MKRTSGGNNNGLQVFDSSQWKETPGFKSTLEVGFVHLRPSSHQHLPRKHHQAFDSLLFTPSPTCLNYKRPQSPLRRSRTWPSFYKCLYCLFIVKHTYHVALKNNDSFVIAAPKEFTRVIFLMTSSKSCHKLYSWYNIFLRKAQAG